MRLHVSDNGRYLMCEDGSPFFYLADTAWELFHRLDREEAERYLTNRAQKGFTVIQAVVLAELDGLNTPNAYGHKPLDENDPTRPNAAYFEHVDFIVDRAAELGLVMGMLPTWGDKWQPKWGKGPAVFTPDNARAYGEFLGHRYRDKPIIWILGGDRNIETEAEHATMCAMAEGLRAGDAGEHLITFHPRGPGRSSDYFHNEDWLDFNMSQSSHAAHDFDNGLFIDHDYALEPAKPTLDGEPRYETIPVGFYLKDVARNDRFDDYDVRQAAYWALLAGACGHTYGNANIWQMWQPGRESVLGACIPWYDAMDHAGAFQMGVVRRLFESRPFHKLEPAPWMILDGPQQGPAKIRAARAGDGSFAIIYTPRGEPFSVDMSAIPSGELTATWFDPRYGISSTVYSNPLVSILTFTPPTSGRGQDWVLVLDDSTAGFGEPGLLTASAGGAHRAE